MDVTALFSLSYGLYIVSSEYEKQFSGQIANTVFQVTADPMTIAISLNKENFTHDIVKKSNTFSVSILEQDTPMEFIGLFGFKSSKNTDKTNGVDILKGSNGCPIVQDHTVASIECEVVKSVDVFTHTLFIGKIINAKKIKATVPMTYAHYHKVKGGKTPPKATTFVKETKMENKWTCTLCGWIYDPSIGDPENGINPGVSFEDLPEDWVCPLCGATKDEFEKN